MVAEEMKAYPDVHVYGMPKAACVQIFALAVGVRDRIFYDSGEGWIQIPADRPVSMPLGKGVG